MRIELVYPSGKKKKLQRSDLIRVLKWPFLFAAYICFIVNLCTGGRAWSVIVAFGLFMVWSLALAPDLVEYNRISQLIKLLAYSCVMLILVDVLLAPGWAVEVVPIVCFSGIAAAGALFFTDSRRQKQNLLPLILLAAASTIAAVVGLFIWRGESRWTLAVMGAFALALLVALAATLGGEFRRELKRRFHTK